MTSSDLTQQLRQWRKANRIKQSALAQQLNVAQSAISRWETGKDHPNPATLRRLAAMMAWNKPDAMLEQAYIERQAGTVALFDLSGVRLLAASAGLKRLWPEFCAATGTSFSEYLVDESRYITTDKSISRFISQGRQIVASGISLRHITIDYDKPVLHRWHARIRPTHERILIDMTYEPCEKNAAIGVEEVLGVDL